MPGVATEREHLTREAIVATARGIVVADGLDGLSLRRVATALGVTAPALYAHIEDKHDLLEEIGRAHV